MDIEAKVKEVVADQLGIADLSTITLESKLIDDLGADSLDAIELVMALEEEFSIEIADDDAEKLLTVKDVCLYVEAKKLSS